MSQWCQYQSPNFKASFNRILRVKGRENQTNKDGACASVQELPRQWGEEAQQLCSRSWMVEKEQEVNRAKDWVAREGSRDAGEQITTLKP